MKIRQSIAAFAAVGVMIGFASVAFAAGPGQGTTTLPALGAPTVVGGLAPAPQTLLVSVSDPYADSYNGTLTEDVYQNTHTGDLTFTYQFSTTATDKDTIDHLSAAGFGGFGPLVGQTAAGGTAPATTANSDDNGNIVDFNFLGGVPPGAMSYLLVITTTATKYMAGNITLDDGTALNLAGYTAAVPEPATIAAFAITGLGIMFLMLNARRKQAYNRVA